MLIDRGSRVPSSERTWRCSWPTVWTRTCTSSRRPSYPRSRRADSGGAAAAAAAATTCGRCRTRGDAAQGREQPDRVVVPGRTGRGIARGGHRTVLGERLAAGTAAELVGGHSHQGRPHLPPAAPLGTGCATRRRWANLPFLGVKPTNRKWGSAQKMGVGRPPTTCPCTNLPFLPDKHPTTTASAPPTT